MIGSGRKGKFNAQGEHVNGQWCASAAEAERYRQLLKMQDEGRIAGLVCQQRYPLVVNNVKITTYQADFTYDVVTDTGEVLRTIIEDVKGMLTDVFEIKHKLFDALNPIPLTLIHKKGKAKHPTIRPDEPSSEGWMHKHWADKIPD